MSPQDDAFHFFNRTDADKEGQRKPHLEEAAMALLLLDVHSAPGKVQHPSSYTSHNCSGTCVQVISVAGPPGTACSRPAWLALSCGYRQRCALGAATVRATLLLRPSAGRHMLCVVLNPDEVWEAHAVYSPECWMRYGKCMLSVVLSHEWDMGAGGGGWGRAAALGQGPAHEAPLAPHGHRQQRG